jgi:hypothetical protein
MNGNLYSLLYNAVPASDAFGGDDILLMLDSFRSSSAPIEMKVVWIISASDPN